MNSRLIILVLIVIVVIFVVSRLIAIGQLKRYRKLKKTKCDCEKPAGSIIHGHYCLTELDRNYSKVPKHYTNDKDNRHRVVITLSTIPERIDLLGPTIGSLLDQTVRVDEICVNVPYVSRKGIAYKIPKWLSKLKSVTVHRVEKDEGPGTKLLPTLRREKLKWEEAYNHETKIITIDDDNIYHSSLVKSLLDEFDKHNTGKDSNRVAITNFGIKLRDRGQLPTIPSRVIHFFNSGREVDLLQGFSGFVLVPSMFPKEVYEIKNCPKEAISVDDVWFSGWLKVNGVKIRSLGKTWRRMPLLNLGEMRETPSLVKNENKGFRSDQIVLTWFSKTHKVW